MIEKVEKKNIDANGELKKNSERITIMVKRIEVRHHTQINQPNQYYSKRKKNIFFSVPKRKMHQKVDKEHKI